MTEVLTTHKKMQNAIKLSFIPQLLSVTGKNYLNTHLAFCKEDVSDRLVELATAGMKEDPLSVTLGRLYRTYIDLHPQ